MAQDRSATSAFLVVPLLILIALVDSLHTAEASSRGLLQMKYPPEGFVPIPDCTVDNLHWYQDAACYTNQCDPDGSCQGIWQSQLWHDCPSMFLAADLLLTFAPGESSGGKGFIAINTGGGLRHTSSATQTFMSLEDGIGAPGYGYVPFPQNVGYAFAYFDPGNLCGTTNFAPIHFTFVDAIFESKAKNFVFARDTDAPGNDILNSDSHRRGAQFSVSDACYGIGVLGNNDAGECRDLCNSWNAPPGTTPRCLGTVFVPQPKPGGSGPDGLPHGCCFLKSSFLSVTAIGAKPGVDAYFISSPPS